MAGTTPRSRAKRDRSFTGCWRCRSRKVKCDEARPGCSACQRLGKPCEGYGPKLVWVESESQTYKSDGRRYMKCESTWEGLPVLDSDLVDYLISQCDTGDDAVIAAEGMWKPSMHNPFQVFQIEDEPHACSPLLSRAGKLLTNGSTHLSSTTLDEKRLFHHYVQHVSFLMMPFEHPRNPWKLNYPAVAINHGSSEEKALYRAIISHAAFNLAHLGSEKDKMTIIATEYYTSAIKELKDSIQCQSGKYAGTVAAIMTLMMAEIYSGRSRKWRCHFKGAWSLLQECGKDKPWSTSDFALFSTQSLCIIRIIGDTCIVDDEDSLPLNNRKEGAISPPQSEDGSDSDTSSTDLDQFGRKFAELDLESSVLSTCDFGFTIGATKVLLECISKITTLGREMRSGSSLFPNSYDIRISEIISALETYEAEIRDTTAEHGGSLAQYQLNAFLNATYIYLYRILCDAPPCNVQQYVSKTLDNVCAFYSQGKGNFSLWPAFIAAVEAYTDEDMILARAWLDLATEVGLGSRIRAKKVVDEVWRRRDQISKEFGIERGLVAVDWRGVMFELDADILLI